MKIISHKRAAIELLAVITVLAVLSIGLVGVQYLKPASAEDDGDKLTDFALFTTQTDKSVTCTSKKAFILYVSVSNFNTADQRLRLKFTDGDFVDYWVKGHTSLSIIHASGGTKGALTDSTIVVEPQGPPKTDVNPLVGDVSAFSKDSHPSCTVQPAP